MRTENGSPSWQTSEEYENCTVLTMVVVRLDTGA